MNIGVDPVACDALVGNVENIAQDRIPVERGTDIAINFKNASNVDHQSCLAIVPTYANKFPDNC